MTPEEQQYYNSLTGGGAEQAAAQEHTQEPTLDFENYARQVGAPVDQIKQDLAKTETEKNNQLAQDIQLGPNGLPMAQQSDLAGAAKGAAQGVAQIAQNVLNFGHTIANNIEDFAASHGIGSGDLISSQGFDFANKLQSPEDSLTTRATRNIVQYAAPVVATMGTGGGALAGLGVSAAYDLLAVDPKQERLSTMLRDNVPELKNYPVAYAAASALANNPNDSELVNRFKNMVEGLGIAAPIAGAFEGIARAGSALSEAGPRIKSLINAGAPQEAVLAATQPLKTEAQLAANEAKIGSNAPIQGDLYDYAKTQTAEGGDVKFNLNNDNVVQFAQQYAQANPKDPSELFRGPKTFAELDSEAKSILTNPSSLDKLLGWKLGDRPLTDAETKASQYLMSNTYQSVVSAAGKAAESGNPEDLLHLSNMLDTFNYVDSARTGAGSEAGRALNAHKLGADLQNVSVEEFNKMLSDKGRQQLVDNAIKAHGGQDNLHEMARQIKAISEIPDADIPKILSESTKGGFAKAQDILSATALNGMLGFKTAVGNFVSNAATTATSAMTNYIAAGVGMIRNTPDAVRFADGNNYIRGMMGGLFKGMEAVGEALRTGKGGPANAIKADIVQAINPISAQGLGIPVEQNMGYRMLGKVADAAGLAVGLPSRINATADAFWGTVMYQGKKYEGALMAADKAALQGAERDAFIAKKMSTTTVAEHESYKEFAQTNTFAKALDPQSFGGKLQDMIEKVPLGKVILPYYKTGSNLIEYGIEHSPLSPLLGPTRDAIARGGKEGDIAIAKATLGSAFLGTAAYMATEGMITGPDTANPRMRQALEESGVGWQPDSIKIGDNYISHRQIQPFSSVLRLGAVLSNLSNYVDQDEYQQLVSVAGTAVADFMSPEMMVDSTNKFFTAYNDLLDYKSNKQAMSSYLAEFAGRFTPLGAIQRDIKNAIDPYKPDMAIAAKNEGWLNKFTDQVINKYKSISPWLSEDLPVKRNIFGEPLLVPNGLGPDLISPFAISKAGGTETVQKLAALAGFKEKMGPNDPTLLDLPISMPSRVWNYKGISLELTPQEYERYVMYSAGLSPDTSKPLTSMPLRGAMEQVLNGMKGLGTEMTPKQYNKIVGAISGVILDYRKIGQNMMLQDPGIMGRWQKAVDAQNSPKSIDVFQ